MASHARYRAPADSGQKLVSPPWSESGDLVLENQQWRAHADVAIVDRPLQDFACEARREILAEAAAYVASYAPDAQRRWLARIAGPAARTHCPPLVVTGHQPEIFHPGVWIKNFAATALARARGGVSLNLIIDSDACRVTSLRVPAGSQDRPRFELVPYDAPAEEMPWEERRILREDLWRAFPEQVGQVTRGLLPGAMLKPWWPTVVERGSATGKIGLGIAQARHMEEFHWGSPSLELPLSRVCQTAAFRRFVCHVLFNLPRFVTAYNQTLADYRRAHRLRNHAHPVPDLGAAGPWLEAPFWLWTAASPRRRPAYVRIERDGLVVSDRQSTERFIARGQSADAEEAVAELGRWEAAGVRLRSRALITTMFARLVLADLFIHGIGGAKYDEATDRMCERFFGASPPRFATVSGTLRLPIARAEHADDDVRRLRQRLRELAYHPEKRLQCEGSAEAATARRLVAEKLSWVSTPKTTDNAAQRHAHIAGANAALQPLLAGERAEAEALLQTALERSRASRVLNSREYAFCLYPRDELRQFLLDFPA